MGFTYFNKLNATYRSDEGYVVKKGNNIMISYKEENDSEIIGLLKDALRYFNDMNEWRDLHSKQILIEGWAYRFDADNIFHVFAYERGKLCLQISGNLEWYHKFVNYYFVELHDIRCDFRECGNQEIGMEQIVKNNGVKIAERYMER